MGDTENDWLPTKVNQKKTIDSMNGRTVANSIKKDVGGCFFSL